MSILGNIALTGTSLAPVLFVYALFAVFEKEYLWASVLILVGLLMVACSVSLLGYFKKHLRQLPLTFCRAEVADRETIGVLVLYLLPLLKTSFTDLEWVVAVPAVVIFLALALTGYNFHFNPVLALLGWRFYRVGTPEGLTYVLITRKVVRGPADKLAVGRLTDYTLIDLESSREGDRDA